MADHPDVRVPWFSLSFSVLVTMGGVAALSGYTATVNAPGWGPLGPLRATVDQKAGVFLLLEGVLGVAALGASRHAGLDRLRRSLVLLFLIGLAMVPVAGDVFTFLVGWELMSSAPGVLLILDPDAERRRAGLLYLTYAQVSAAAIMSGLLIWGAGTDYTLEELLRTTPPVIAPLLVLVGAAIKAGVMPFHSWLPAAHAAAPSHVSALMSGALVAVPAYLVVRLVLPSPVPVPAAVVTLLLGALSATLGSLHALHERHLKRALALTTVAHMGILFALLGLGLLLPHVGARPLMPFVASAALAYALTHGWSKGALFLVAGEVLHSTGTLDMERLGGLWRRMGRLAVVGGLAGVALAGLPPFGGFVSEVSVFAAFFASLPALDAVSGVTVLGGLFLVGVAAGAGIAAICKMTLGTFHGPLREQPPAVDSKRPGPWAPGFLLAASLAAAVVPGFVWRSSPTDPFDWGRASTAIGGFQTWPMLLASALLAILAIGAIRTRPRPRSVDPWACGLAPPSPRQTYSAQALVMPYRILFAEILRPGSDLRLQDAPVAPFAPFKGRYEDRTPQYVEPWVHQPVRGFFTPAIERLRHLHRGPVHSYLIIALLFLVVLLFLMPVIR